MNETTTTTDLLAGLIDLGGPTPPHAPGDCAALCGPGCTGTAPATE